MTTCSKRVNPMIAKKHPGYDAIKRLIKVRDDLFMAGCRPRLATPMLLAILARLKDRELSACFPRPAIAPRKSQEILNFDKLVSGASRRNLPARKRRLPSTRIVSWRSSDGLDCLHHGGIQQLRVRFPK